MSKKLKLLASTYLTDNIGQLVPTEAAHEVFCNVSSITAGEFARAGQIGLKPTFQFSVWDREYNGEEVVVYEGARYKIYRTYKSGNGRIELYVHGDVGS